MLQFCCTPFDLQLFCRTNRPTNMYYRLEQELTEVAAYALLLMGSFVITHQVATVFRVKWREMWNATGHHLESVTQVENPTLSILSMRSYHFLTSVQLFSSLSDDGEQSSQIASRSDLKRRSLLGFLTTVAPNQKQQQEQEQDKTAELSQRRQRDARNIWVSWKVLRVLTTHPATCPEICNGLLFRSILRMCVQNLKFVALPVPEIMGGGTQKIWTVPGYAHAPFSRKILKGFCSDGPCQYTCQIWSS